MCRAGRQWGQANALNSSTPVQNANKKSESCSRRYRQKIENVTKDTRKSNETLLNKLGRKFGNPVRLLKSYERLSCCRNKKSYAVNMEPGPFSYRQNLEQLFANLESKGFVQSAQLFMNLSVLQNNVQKTASNKRHLEIKPEKSKYCTMSHDQNAGQYQSIIFFKYEKFQLFGNSLNKLKFRS